VREVDLVAVFREVFGDPKMTISSTTSPRDIALWDSFNHLRLMMAIEAEADATFKTLEVVKLVSVSDIVRALETRGVAVRPFAP
jgi:acyl carrier protein